MGKEKDGEGREWGEGNGEVMPEASLCPLLSQVKVANLKVGSQDLGSLGQPPSMVPKDQSPQPARSGLAFPLESPQASRAVMGTQASRPASALTPA